MNKFTKKNALIAPFKWLFVLFFTVFTCFSQSNNSSFYSLNIQGALFNKKVNTLFVDSIGFLWIGTNSGLYRYDGHNLIEYQNSVFDTYSIPNNSINSIVEDNNNNLWIGSESFLIYYDRKQNKFNGYYKNNTSVVLKKTSDGKIWVNARNIGLVQIEPNQNIDKIQLQTHFNYNELKNLVKFDKQINAIVEDSFKRMWTGTSKGIYLLNKKNHYVPTNFTQEVVTMKDMSNNRIAVLTKRDLYIVLYNKADHNLEILEAYPNFMNSFGSQGNGNTMTFSPNGQNIWIGTSDGLIKASRNNNKYQFSHYSKGTSNGNLLSNQISTLLFDSYDNLWIGSSNGINKQIARTALFDFNAVENFSKIKNSFLNCILQDTGNNLLIGTNNGLYRYNSKSYTYSEIEASAATKITQINTVFYNYDKTELFISSDSDLYKSVNYNPNANRIQLIKIKSYNKRITDVNVISSKEIWVGLWEGGIDVINTDNTISKFKKEVVRKLANHHTSAIYLASDFKLWIGTRGEGLYKIDLNHETFKEYKPSKDGLSSNAILAIQEDHKKRIWIGTRGGGLNLYDKKRDSFKNFNKNNGLAPKTIAAIEEDNNGTIWMSTQEGLTCFNPANEKFTPFGSEDGIKLIQFVYNSSAKSKNQLYFASSEGFYVVHPKHFLQKHKAPSTVITNFLTLEASKNTQNTPDISDSSTININANEPIVLPYDKNNIVINFSSLDLTSPRKNEYSYILEGLNNYWVHTTASNRNANYNDLAPGTYTFKVKSANSDGIWNEKPTVLKFTITPPFWKSTIAYIIYWILFGLLIYFSYVLINNWYNLKNNLIKETISREKDNEFNNMKMVFFTDISHELRTPLTLILGTIEKVIKEKEYQLNPLTAQRIYNNTLRMLRLINQILDVRKFDVGKLKLTISKNNIVEDIKIIKNSFNDFAKINGIEYQFISQEDKIIGWYDVDILEKILFNILSNAFKFTKENGIISVILAYAQPDENDAMDLDFGNNTYIKCAVRDNGIGIPKKDLEYIFDRYYQSTQTSSNHVPGTGIGMELVHKLIERHHGVIKVESEENIFTEFTFYLPINKKRYPKSERINSGMPLKKSFIESSEFQVIDEISSEFDSHANAKNKTKPSLLLVEDNLELRTMLKEELIEEYRILEASNGSEGYEIALQEKPLLIISDILMPIEDGISMLTRLKDNNETHNIPIFMLTAKTAVETKINCLSLGAQDYIEKPFSLEFVKWKVKNVLDSRQELKEKYSKVITTEPSEIEIESNDEKFIKKLIKIIEDSMNDNLLSVEYLASEVGMSRANLYRKLQSIINDTPVNFIKTIRLKRAAQLLKKNEMYISEIAYMTGFNNQKYFGKCFHKEFGMSPTEYIKKYAEKEKNENIDFS
ncbi:hybrid sensor histidine kinase/response regulator transcription factor [Flavobacterium sp. UMI-01]|uniref:hybrid sensor histidine kinase/response regulator transcription factor n=1 Tax=Flavobacterium sp. UMI-01 TaxID=1441053 RepID=UPI001C7D9B74|nr:hybrid sensor histidine kinase/response regulator transcription factor [Flavobacterium sp. UMI-01]GIZ09725.1 hybrid sensor histidine kinase/response regulator [Flavobacterium sp. UMI-01]